MAETFSPDEKTLVDLLAKEMAQKFFEGKQSLQGELVAFIYFNEIETLEAYKYAEEEILIRVQKKKVSVNGTGSIQLRELLTKKIKRIYKPYIGNRKIKVNIHFT